MPASAEVAAAVDDVRLARLIRDVSAIGALPGGGLDRQALTPEDLAARRLLVDLAGSYGASAVRDPAGNFFFRWPGTNDQDPVVTGSHIDSQPAGGHLDGTFGVCAAVEVLAALSTVGYRARHPIEAAIWTNEEGCRFSPGTMGAAAFARPALLDEYREAADPHGVTFAEALAGLDAAFPDVPVRGLGVPFRAFVEAHIEQGPALEEADVPVGVVDGVQGARWFTVRTTGEAAHAGTTPRSRKRDALAAAVRVATSVYRLLADGDDLLRLTIGRARVWPGSINVVPAEAELTVDLRHPDATVLDAFEARLRELARPTNGCAVELERTMVMPPTRFDDRVVGTIADSAAEQGLQTLVLGSGAFHDALRIAEHCPTGMLFVPSIGGISHNPAEATEPRHLMIGTRLLADTVVRLADGGRS